jgi:nucleoside diphosphate kinase
LGRRGVIKYGRKLIGATNPQKSEPGTIRGDLAVVVGRYTLFSVLFLAMMWYSEFPRINPVPTLQLYLIPFITAFS